MCPARLAALEIDHHVGGPAIISAVVHALSRHSLRLSRVDIGLIRDVRRSGARHFTTTARPVPSLALEVARLSRGLHRERHVLPRGGPVSSSPALPWWSTIRWPNCFPSTCVAFSAARRPPLTSAIPSIAAVTDAHRVGGRCRPWGAVCACVARRCKSPRSFTCAQGRNDRSQIAPNRRNGAD